MERFSIQLSLCEGTLSISDTKSQWCGALKFLCCKPDIAVEQTVSWGSFETPMHSSLMSVSSSQSISYSSILTFDLGDLDAILKMQSFNLVWILAYPKVIIFMMMSSNGNIFRVTGPLCGEFIGPQWNPLTNGSDVFFDLRLNKRLSKHSRRWWFETPSRSLWRHCNADNRITLQIESWNYKLISIGIPRRMVLWPYYICISYTDFN